MDAGAALTIGLRLKAVLRIKPLQFGMVTLTDTHTGLFVAGEDHTPVGPASGSHRLSVLATFSRETGPDYGS